MTGRVIVLNSFPACRCELHKGTEGHKGREEFKYKDPREMGSIPTHAGSGSLAQQED
jgi:hypothetical protein